MKSLKRLFGRKSTRKIKRRLPFRISRPIGYASHVERLEDRTLLASNILASLESSVNQPNEPTELQLTVGDGGTPTLGFEVRATSGSLDPAVVQILDSNTNAVIPLQLAENDHGGTTNSLALATLAPGEYIINVSGQNAGTGNFTIDIFMPGDSDGSGSVSDTEYQYALAASYQNLFGFNAYTSQLIQSMGLDPTKNYYSEELDSDLDGDIDNNDLQNMDSNRNVPQLQMELIGDQEAPEVVAGLLIDSGVSSSDGITNDLTIVGTVSDESLITQFQVALDGGPYTSIFGKLSGGANGGSFTLDRTWLETNLSGGSLEGGTHTLHFMTEDEHGNISTPGAFDVTFELDATAPTTASTIPDRVLTEALEEDFGSENLGAFTNFFNQNGGTPLTYRVDSISHAIVNFDFATDELILTSRQDVYGTADIVIQAIDAAGNAVLSNTFTVTVNAVNDPPVAVDDSLGFLEDISYDYLAPGILANDTDVENDPLTVTEVNGSAGDVGNEITIGAGGKLTLESNGSFSFNPDGVYNYLAVGETATETFTYTVSDGNGGTDTASVTITIHGANDAPVADDDDFTITQNETLNMNHHSVFNSNGNGVDYDPDTSDSIEVTAVNGSAANVGNEVVLASGASLTLFSGGNISYRPNGVFDYLALGETATETFTYTLSDGNGGTDTATVTISITGVNDDPIANPNTILTIGADEDNLVNVPAGAIFEFATDAENDSLLITEINGAVGNVGATVTIGLGGLLTANADGSFTFDPNDSYDFLAVGESYEEAFTYKISDGNGGTDGGTYTIRIHGVNDAPIAEDDGFATDEDTPTGGDLFADNGNGIDSDPDTSDSFTVSKVNDATFNVGSQFSLLSGALLTVNADGTFVYDPNGAFDLLAQGGFDSDSFTYTVDDGNGGTSIATVTIDIAGVNDAPVASNGSLDADEDGSTVTTGVLAVDVDLGATLTYEITLQPSEGTASSNGNGTFTFDPGSDFQDLAAGETRQVTFNFTAKDDHNAVSNTGTVTVTVTGVNDAPTVANDSLAADEDGVTVTTGVLAADVDSDDDETTLVYAITVQPTEGTATSNDDGTFTFDPGSDFQDLGDGETRQVTFDFTATDSHNAVSNTGTVTVTVTGVNDAPVAWPNTILSGGAGEDSPSGLSAGAIFNYATDAEDDPLEVTEINGSAGNVGSQISIGLGGLLTAEADGSFIFDPNDKYDFLAVGESYEEAFTYKIDDGNGGTDTGTYTIRIHGVNDAPVAANASLSADEDGAAVTTGVLTADIDTDDNPGTLTYAITLLPSEGTATSNDDGTFTFDPGSDFQDLAADETRQVTFNYTATDSHTAVSNTGTVTVTVTGVNDDPTAVDDDFAIHEDTTIAGGNLFLDNGNGADSDPDASDVPFVSLVNGSAGNVGSQFTLPSGALLLVNSTGTFNYDPNGVYNYLAVGEEVKDSFTYQIDDGNGGVDTATATVTITGRNDDPIAVDDLIETDEHSPVSGSLFANNGSGEDSDPDTSDSFTITEVNGNSALVGTQITAGGILLTVNANGSFTFDPNEAYAALNLGLGESYTQNNVFTYTIEDSQGATSTASVSIKINGENDPPDAVDDALSTDEDNILNGNVLAANPTTADSDPDNTDTITVSEVNGAAGNVGGQFALPSGALLTLSANGDVSYDPNGIYDYLAVGESAVDTFSYTIADNHGLTDVATVTITIDGVNDPPVAQDDDFDVNKESPINGNVFGFNGNGIDSDPDTSDSFNVTLIEYDDSGIQTEPVTTILPGEVTLQHGGLLTLSANGDFTYDPTQSAELTALTGTDSLTETFTYTIDDGNGGTDTATVTIVISANQLPIANPDTGLATDEDTPLNNIDVLSNDTDPDGDDANLFVAGLPAPGSLGGAVLSLNLDGTIDYDPTGVYDYLEAGETAVDTFFYTLEDERGGQSTGTATVTITGVNDAPTSTNNTVTTNEDTLYIFTAADFNFSDVDGDPLATVQITSLETVGDLRLNGAEVTLNQVITKADIDAGLLTFLPGLNENGASYDSFDFLVNDGTENATASSTMTVDVTPVNDPPLSADNTVTTDEDTTYTFTASDFGYSDVEGAPLASVQITSLETVGALQLNNVDVTLNQVITKADIDAGLLTFAPVADENGSAYDSFDFLVNDGTDDALSASTMTIDVTPVNDAPTSTNNTVTTNEDTTYTFSAADFNFSDVDSGDDLVSVEITTLETVGALQLDNVDVTLNQVITRADIDAGKLKFVPVANANGAGYDSFGFLVNDGTVDATASSTMTIDVTAVNDAPTATDNTVTTDEDVTYTFSASDFNYSDVEGSPLATVQITSLETVGALKLNGVDVTLNQVIDRADIDANLLTFVPVADENGAGYDSFGFLVNDGTVNATSSSTMTINVTPVNDAPTSSNKTVTTSEDTPYVFSAADFEFNDVDGGSLYGVKITSLPANGTLVRDSVPVSSTPAYAVISLTLGQLQFIPAENENGTGYASFEFQVLDGDLLASDTTYTMTIDVTPVNDPPTATDNTVTTDEDTPYIFTAADFNFSDVEGDDLASVEITSLEAVGALKLNGVDVTQNQVISKADIDNNLLTFVPVANANGSPYDSFDFLVNDGTDDATASSTMTIDVTAVNDAPTSTNNTVTTDEDTTYTFAASDFNFSDVDSGDTLASIEITALETVGALKLDGVDVTLNQVITKAEIDANLLTFDPVADENGAGYDSFNFLVNDGTVDATASSTMTIDVTPVNDAPTSNDRTILIDEDSTYTFSDADFSFNDVDGDSLVSVQITTLPAAGDLEFNSSAVNINDVFAIADIISGKLKFTPALNGNGTGYASFDFLVNDGTVNSDSAYTLTVDVTPINDAPTSTNNTVNTDEDTTYVFSAADFNFSDVDTGDSLASVEITSLETVGALQLDNVDVTLNQVITKADIDAGKLKFVPVADENGAGYDSFNFLVNDGTVDATASSTMTINVAPVNDAPTSTNNTVTTDEDITYTFTAADFNFSDVDTGDTLASVEITTLETVGALQLDNVDVTLNQVITRADIDAGKLKFVPVANANGAGYDSFGFLVNDGTVDATASSTMTIDVTPINDAPTSTNNTVTTDEDTTYIFAASDFNFSDVEGSPLASVEITSLETVGALKLNGVDVTLNQVISKADIDNNLLTFDPVADENGSPYDSFNFLVNDGTLDATTSSTMTINVDAVNDPPTAVDDTLATDKNTPRNFDVRTNDTDPDSGDTLTVIKITDTTLGEVTINSGDTITLDSGAKLTLETDGTLTYDPRDDPYDNFSGLVLPADKYADEFTYTIEDSSGSPSTATVFMDVTGSNELLMSTTIPDLLSDGLAEDVIDLSQYFSDADAGDTITYELNPVPTLSNGDPLPTDIWTNNIFISGNELHIQYSTYAPEQVRLPVKVSVKATSSDGISPPLTEEFTVTPDPAATAEIRLIARPTASEGRDFTYFRATQTFESILAGAKGNAAFNLTNGLQDLNYTIALSDYNNTNAGEGPLVDVDTDVTAVQIIDTSAGDAVLFTIYDKFGADDDPAFDATTDILTGIWSASDTNGLTSAIIDKLYNGDLAVRVQVTGLTDSLVSGSNIHVSAEVDDVGSLPAEQTTYYTGQDYVVEIWVSDQLAQLLSTDDATGFLGVDVSLNWEGAGNIPEGLRGVATDGASAFTFIPGVGVTDNDGNVILNFHGTAFNLGVGEGGSYARVGYGEFKAFQPTADATPINFSVTLGDDPLTTSNGILDDSQISIVGTDVTQLHSYQFNVQTDQSNISVSGTVTSGATTASLGEQNVGLADTSLSGRVSVVLDDLDNPTTVQIVDSYAEVNPAGLANPERGATGDLTDFDLADFGLKGQLFGGDFYVAIRDAIASMFSSQQPLSGGLFSVTDPWTLTNGQIDSFLVFGGSFVSGPNSDTTSSLEMTFFNPGGTPPAGLSSWTNAELTESGGVYTLVVPISRSVTFVDSTGAEITLEFTGSITSTFKKDQSDQYGDTIGTATDTLMTSATPETKVYQGAINEIAANLDVSGSDPDGPNIDKDLLADVDMFLVHLEAGGSMTVDIDADMFNTGLDSVIRIFDASGTQVAYSDNTLAPDEFLIVHGLKDSYVTYTNNTGSAGDFYIGVSALNAAYNAGVSYDPNDTTQRDSAHDPNVNISPFDGGSYDLTISVYAGAAPLHGTQSLTSDAPLTEGSTVDMAVVRTQTDVDSTGHVDGLPTSDTWIDEWSSFWVEIYVETADANAILNAAVDLNYNTSFFTATEIEFGRAFASNGKAVIDDATGIVSSLGGTSVFDRVGSTQKALLARVKFESLEQDDVSIDFEDKFIGPHALGLSLTNVSLGLEGGAETNIVVGDAPETDLWAIAYDVNDDDIINYKDLTILASVYGQNVLDTNSPYVWALDADKSGTVNYKDLTFFATNYGVHKGGDKEVTYPSNFLQRWYGQTTSISGDSSIDQVMDSALGIWQDALGMDEPLDIQLVITDLGGSQLGEGQMTAVDENGRPVAGIVTLDDDAAGLGWYSDISTTAFGGGELEGGVTYTADIGSDAVGHYDLLTVLLHEIGHVLGFSETYAPFESHVQADAGGTLTFVGSGFEATLTSDGLHLDDTVHSGDIMNATLDPGVRKLPSILDTLILQTAHETAASGDFEIQVGVTAPLTANLPLTGNQESSVLPETVEPLASLVEPVVELVPVSYDVSNSHAVTGGSVLTVWSQLLNPLNQDLSSGSEPGELDLTLLDGLNEEFVQTLRQNGLSIVEAGENNSFSNRDDVDFELTGLDQAGDVNFDDVFTDWSGPIL